MDGTFHTNGQDHASNGAEVRAWMAGNLCRCAVYPNFAATVLDAAGMTEAAE